MRPASSVVSPPPPTPSTTRRPSDKLSGTADYEAFQAGTLARSLTDTRAKFIPAERVINLTELICSARPPKSSQPARQMVERDFLDGRRVTWSSSRGGTRTKEKGKHLGGEGRKGRTDIKEGGQRRCTETRTLRSA